MTEYTLNKLLSAFDEQIDAEKGIETTDYTLGRIDGIDTGRALIEEILNIEDPKERVIEEHAELELKLNKLDAFIESDGFNRLGERRQARLKSKFFIMRDYLNILNLCIQEWDKQ